MIDYAKTDRQKAELAEKILNSKGPISVEMKLIRTRSQEQNAAMHLWLTWVAEALNEAGYDMQTVLSEGAGLSWTMESAKENLWRPIQKAMLKKQSTTELYKPEVSDVYEHLNRFLSTKFGIHIKFPDKNDLYGEAG